MGDATKKNRTGGHFSQQQLKQVFDNLPDTIFVTDAKGNVLLSNSTTALTLGISLDQLLKSNLGDLVRQGYYNRSYALEAAEKKQVVGGLIKTKLNFTMISTSTPVLDENGDVMLVVTVGRPKDLIDKYMSAEEKEQVIRRKREIEYLRSYVLETDTIVAESRAMRQVLLSAHAVAQADSTVILYGESGTGKEVLAKYIHRHSKRAQEAFIAINCAALPEHLVESELFGYERGAFTGASNEGKMGLFEAAHRGTLFLDEIAELPLPLQAKLLRVLETGEVRRLGSHSSKRVDFRLIAATHKDLKQMAGEGKFRHDLYWRLNVIPLRLPPLRERPEDIVALALKFTEDFNKKYNTTVELDGDTLAALAKYNWPGNVRELRNIIERRAISSLQGYFPDSLDVVAAVPGVLAMHDCFRLFGISGTLKEVLDKVEQRYIQAVLAECNGKVTEAARRLGICRTVLHRKLKAMEQNKNNSLSGNVQP